MHWPTSSSASLPKFLAERDPLDQWKVPLTTLTIGEEEEEAVLRVLRRGWLTMGPEVEAFEAEFAEALGVAHAIAVANATGGLALAYDGVGVEPGDEVAMPALSFVAAMNSALRRDLLPVLVDIESPEDLTASLEDFRRKITPKTRVLLTMPYAGFAPDMDAIMRLAKEYHIPVVEDACHGVLASWKGRKLGTYGAVGVFSFYGNKNLTTGEGGMVVTNDHAIDQRIRQMRNHGITKATYERHHTSAAQYDVLVAGHNFRMCEINAAIGRAQLRKLPWANQRRREIAAQIRELVLARRDDILFPFTHYDQGESSHHLLVAVLPQKCRREEFMMRMAEHGVQTSVHYRPLHRFTHTTGLWEKDPHLPVLESIEDRYVTLPLGPMLTDEQIELIARATVTSLN